MNTLGFILCESREKIDSNQLNRNICKIIIKGSMNTLAYVIKWCERCDIETAKEAQFKGFNAEQTGGSLLRAVYWVCG